MKNITTIWTTEDVLRISGGGITTEQAERILEDELYYDIHEGCISARIHDLIVGYVRDEKLKELEREQQMRGLSQLFDVKKVRLGDTPLPEGSVILTGDNK